MIIKISIEKMSRQVKAWNAIEMYLDGVVSKARRHCGLRGAPDEERLAQALRVAGPRAHEQRL